MKLKDLLKESWEVKDGKVLSNGKLVGYYEFNRDSDSFWVDDVNKGKGQLSFETKKEVEELIGDKVLTYKVVKSYRGYKVTKVRVVAIKAKDSKEVTITLKLNK